MKLGGRFEAGQFGAGRFHAGRFCHTGGTIPDGVPSSLTISGFVAVATSDTTLFVDFDVSEGGGVAHVYVSGSATAPAVPDWKDGTGAEFWTSAAISGTASYLGGPNGLTPTGNYHVHVLYEKGAEQAMLSSAQITMPAVDNVPPILSNPVATVSGENALNPVSVDTDEASGTVFMVGTPFATAPTDQQIKDGKDHTGADASFLGVKAVTGVGAVDFAGGFGGLTETPYHLYFVHFDSSLNPSNIASVGPRTPTDNVAPVVSSVDTSNIDATTLDVTFNSDTPEGTAFVVLSPTSDKPSPAQVKAGTDQNDVACPAFTMAISTAGVHVFNATGLTPSTGYWAHVVQEDAATIPNLSSVESTGSVAATLSGTTYFSALNDGTSDRISSSRLTENLTEPDTDGGNLGVIFRNDGSGPAVTSFALVVSPANVTSPSTAGFIDGVNLLEVVVGIPVATVTNRYMRIRPLNVSSGYNDILQVDLTDTTPDRNRVISAGPQFSDTTLTRLAANRILLSTKLDFTGCADLNGRLTFYPSSSSSGGAIDDNSTADTWETFAYNAQLSEVTP